MADAGADRQALAAELRRIADLNDCPEPVDQEPIEITWGELREISALMRRAADLLAGDDELRAALAEARTTDLDAEVDAYLRGEKAIFELSDNALVRLAERGIKRTTEA